MVRAREEASPQSKAQIQGQYEPSTLWPGLKFWGTQWSLLAQSKRSHNAGMGTRSCWQQASISLGVPHLQGFPPLLG